MPDYELIYRNLRAARDYLDTALAEPCLSPADEAFIECLNCLINAVRLNSLETED